MGMTLGRLRSYSSGSFTDPVDGTSGYVNNREIPGSKEEDISPAKRALSSMILQRPRNNGGFGGASDFTTSDDFNSTAP